MPGRVPGRPDGRMRRLAVAAICVGLLAACGGMGPRRQSSQEFRRLEADYAQAWEVTLRTLTERGYAIRTADRDAGIIETGWLTINPEYAATVFVTEREDRYGSCGRPPLGQAYRTKQARLILALRPMRHGETGLRVEAAFRTQRYSDPPLLGGRPLGESDCSSRGRLEEELKLEIQFRALSDQLERIRRGAP